MKVYEICRVFFGLLLFVIVATIMSLALGISFFGDYCPARDFAELLTILSFFFFYMIVRTSITAYMCLLSKDKETAKRFIDVLFIVVFPLTASARDFLNDIVVLGV